METHSNKLILLLLLLFVGCDFYAGHCYYFAADYLVNGKAKYWPAVGNIYEALDHVYGNDWGVFVDDELNDDWVEKYNCVVYTGSHYIAVRKSEEGYEYFDFVKSGGWKRQKVFLLDLICMERK